MLHNSLAPPSSACVAQAGAALLRSVASAIAAIVIVQLPKVVPAGKAALDVAERRHVLPPQPRVAPAVARAKQVVPARAAATVAAVMMAVAGSLAASVSGRSTCCAAAYHTSTHDTQWAVAAAAAAVVAAAAAAVVAAAAAAVVAAAGRPPADRPMAVTSSSNSASNLPAVVAHVDALARLQAQRADGGLKNDGAGLFGTDLGCMHAGGRLGGVGWGWG